MQNMLKIKDFGLKRISQLMHKAIFGDIAKKKNLAFVCSYYLSTVLYQLFSILQLSSGAFFTRLLRVAISTLSSVYINSVDGGLHIIPENIKGNSD